MRVRVRAQPCARARTPAFHQSAVRSQPNRGVRSALELRTKSRSGVAARYASSMQTSGDVPPLYRAGDSVAGQLRVEALLGQGGAGAVYRVRDERKGGRLALKQLRAADSEHKALLTSQLAREFHTLS